MSPLLELALSQLPLRGGWLQRLVEREVSSRNLRPLPRVSPLPVTGGQLKTYPEDFLVEEVHERTPSGEGEHLYLWVEKTDMTAEELRTRIGETLGVKTHELGMAGLKDKRAVTRQYVSVPARCEPLLSKLETDRLRLLEVHRHHYRLPRGALYGNRFTVRVRSPEPGGSEQASQILRQLSATGLPNFFGSQRFGAKNSTLRMGYELLFGLKKPKAIPRFRRNFLLGLALSAAQSDLFNRVLTQRIDQGSWRTVLPGDLVRDEGMRTERHSGGETADQAAYEARRLTPTGPMFGPRMAEPSGPAALLEERALFGIGLCPADFARFPKASPGARRPLTVWPEDATVEDTGDGYCAHFVLPRGAYATVLLAELTGRAG